MILFFQLSSTCVMAAETTVGCAHCGDAWRHIMNSEHGPRNRPQSSGCEQQRACSSTSWLPLLLLSTVGPQHSVVPFASCSVLWGGGGTQTAELDIQPGFQRHGGEAQREGYFLICTDTCLSTLRLDVRTSSPATYTCEISTCGLVKGDGRETTCKRL